MLPALILSVGHDLTLLDTRSQVLRAVGHAVVKTTSIKEAAEHLQTGDFDLVVLCHSVPANLREKFIHSIRTQGSRVPVIFVSKSFLSKDPLADATVESTPGELLAGIEAVLQQQAQGRQSSKGAAPLDS